MTRIHVKNTSGHQQPNVPRHNKDTSTRNTPTQEGKSTTLQIANEREEQQGGKAHITHGKCTTKQENHKDAQEKRELTESTLRQTQHNTQHRETTTPQQTEPPQPTQTSCVKRKSKSRSKSRTKTRAGTGRGTGTKTKDERRKAYTFTYIYINIDKTGRAELQLHKRIKTLNKK